jgi:enoyl-CoA hydratase/carnithine racemase
MPDALVDLDTAEVEFADGVMRTTFRHPPINLVGPEVVCDLARLLDAIEHNDEVRVLVIESGDPDFFFAHADMVALARPRATGARPAPLTATLRRLAEMSTVSIAKIAGRARGAGSEIALACDLRFASVERAVFAQPEVGVGLIPGAGATQRLPGLVGRGRALEAILGCEDFGAPIAERYGWINRAIPDAELDTFVDALALRIASFPTAALAAAKASVNRATRPAPEALAHENHHFTQLLSTPEVAHRVGWLLANGGQRRGDVERDLGAALATLPPRVT